VRCLRLRIAPALVTVAVLAALTAATPGAAGASPTPTQTVRSYIAAINAKDGKKICSLLHPAEGKAIAYYIGWIFSRVGQPVKTLPCPKVMQLIGSGGGRDNAQLWHHAKILHMSAPRSGGDGLVSIDVRMLDSYEDTGAAAEDRTTRFWLQRFQGRWLIVRRSSTLDMAMFSVSDPLADERPATREPSAVSVKIPKATFTCSDEIWATDDPAGDAHAPGRAWLDIRHVALARTPSFCVTVELGAPPIAGTAFDVSFDTTDHRRSLTGDLLVIDPDGTVIFTGSDKLPVAGVDYGMADATTLVMRFSDIPDFQPDTIRVVARPVSKSEPLIGTQPLLAGGDEAAP
jgi:hypothetical protein